MVFVNIVILDSMKFKAFFPFPVPNIIIVYVCILNAFLFFLNICSGFNVIQLIWSNELFCRAFRKQSWYLLLKSISSWYIVSKSVQIVHINETGQWYSVIGSVLICCPAFRMSLIYSCYGVMIKNRYLIDTSSIKFNEWQEILNRFDCCWVGCYQEYCRRIESSEG